MKKCKRGYLSELILTGSIIPRQYGEFWKVQEEGIKWPDDPGADPEDAEEYWKAWEPGKTYCQCCGRETVFIVAREDGSFFCDECHKANPEKDDDDAGDHDQDKDGDDAGGDDADDKGDDDDAGDHDKGDGGKEVTALRKRISDLESKLATAVAERERLYSENAELKLIIEGLQKQIASPATAPADNGEPVKVDRKVMHKALKAAGNEFRKVKLP